MFKHILILFLPVFLCSQTVVLDSLQVEAVNKLERENFHKTQTIQDSIISIAITGNLTDLLREQTPIFFKESGAGMVSSVSFRGTTAQHTAVLWNGLNINSQLLGQTDFNAISFATADELLIEYGSGGTESGSGAIGGTIALNNLEKFNQNNKQTLSVGLGSFNHKNFGYSNLLSNKNSFFQVKFFKEKSDNNYEIKERNYENINGDFWKNDLSFNFGYKFNHKNKILFYNEIYNDKRNFSLIIPTEAKSKYYNFNQRHLIQYKYIQNKISFEPEIAFIKEKYKYYPNKYENESSGNGVNSFINNINFNYKYSHQLLLEAKGGFVFRENFPESSVMEKVKRKEYLSALRAVYSPYKVFNIEVGGRKEWISNYSSPFLYSFVINFKPLKILDINLKTASTFRVPSFNDLYWQPGGNKSLKAEYAKAYEISSNLKWKDLKFTVNTFHQNIENMIRWMPTDKGYWKAFNINEVNINGIESTLNYQFSVAKILTNINLFIGYTDAKDVKEDKTLIYVPPLKAGFNLAFNYKNASIGWNNRYVDDVYFSVGKEEDSKVESYYLNNIFFKYKFLDNKLTILFKINNLNNKIYQTILNRYQPKRNINLKLSYEIL